MKTNSNIKVLMIDRSKFACLAVRRILSVDPVIEFNFATQIESAIRFADEYLPTALLYSVDGLESEFDGEMEGLRKNPSTRDVPVILVTELDCESKRDLESNLKGNSFVSKLDDPDKLLMRIYESSRDYIEALRKDIPDKEYSTRESRPARVLMIDDSRTVCLGFQKIIEGEKDIDFKYCNDPTLGLETAKEFRPTVILLDLEMPGLSGFELLPILRAEPSIRDVPIIVLSGITDPKVKADVFGLGANDYAEKNMDSMELFSRIRYHTTAFENGVELDRSINQLLEVKKHLEIQRNFVRKTFGRYLSDEIVNNILETPEGLELGGEKQSISIMMADLRGFTSLGERLEPEHVLSIINNYLSRMTEVLAKYGGTIDEFIGDAILAMFGAPVRQDDFARRAVACAVEMQLAMADVNKWNREQGFLEIAMGIGINTGDVIVGNIGSERRAKYGIVGRNVNLTGRIESCTVGGQILISESTYKACGGLLRIDGRSEVMPKGVDKPITIYEVGGVGGEFDLYLPAKRRSTIPKLDASLCIDFQVLEGKFAVEELCKGTLVGIFESEALLDTDVALAKFQDLKITLTDPDGSVLTRGLYAKVLEESMGNKSMTRIHFTSVPEEARAFFKQALS